MPNTLLGCYPPSVLLTSGASASGTGSQMPPRDCEKLCLDQQASLRRDPQNGNPSFNFFTIKEAANECACAPAMDRTVAKLKDNDCGGRNSPGVLLYSLSDPASASSSSTAPSRTTTNGAKPTNAGSGPDNATADPSGSGESGSGNAAVISTVSILALVVALLGAMYFRQRRRNQELGKQVLRSNSLTTAPSHSLPPPTAVSPTSHHMHSMAPPKVDSTAIIPTAAPPMPADNAGVVMVPFARSATNPVLESTSPPVTQTLAPPAPAYPVHASPAMLATSPPASAPTPLVPVAAPPMDLSTLPIVPTDELLAYGVHADPTRQYLVYRGYQPTLDDELALVLGEGVVLLEVYDDGWALGRVTSHHRQGAPEGVFPVVALVPEVDAEGVVELPPETMGREAEAAGGENQGSRPVRLPGQGQQQQAPQMPPAPAPAMDSIAVLQVNERRSSMMNSPGSLPRRMSANGTGKPQVGGGQGPPM